MNDVSMRPWLRVRDEDLLQWAGARRLAIARAIVKGGRVRDLVCSSAGEGFATVGDTKVGKSFTAGVLMQLEGRRKRRAFSSLCACDRGLCEHSVAVAIALRAAVGAHKTPPRMSKDDRRVQDLPRSGTIGGLESWEVPEADGSWLPEDGRSKREPDADAGADSTIPS